MKIVQGIQRQYQLVDKTKRKDLDGVVYLVAGEKNLWVKLLKDKSVSKKGQIAMLISCGGSAGFEKPLEIVTDSKGAFVGYTFRGTDMEIVPEKNLGTNKKNKKSGFSYDNGVSAGAEFGSNTKNKPMENPSAEGHYGMPMETRKTGENLGACKWLALGIIGVLMFVLLELIFDKWLLVLIYTNISQVAGEGCAQLSFGGLLPGVVGISGMLLYQKGFGKNINSLSVYCVMAVVSFVSGVLLTYAVIGVICALAIGIFGIVKTYQTVIVTVIMLAILGKVLLSRR